MPCLLGTCRGYVDGNVDVRTGCPDYDYDFGFYVSTRSVYYGIRRYYVHGYGFTYVGYVFESLSLENVGDAQATDFGGSGAYACGKTYEIS